MNDDDESKEVNDDGKFHDLRGTNNDSNHEYGSAEPWQFATP